VRHQQIAGRGVLDSIAISGGFEACLDERQAKT
jgi:hypothetical protein